MKKIYAICIKSFIIFSGLGERRIAPLTAIPLTPVSVSYTHLTLPTTF